MLNQKPKESDWKCFRKIVPDLRERYLRRKNQELVRLLADPEKTPTEQFWETFEKMKKEQKILTDCLDNHSRSRMFMAMALMLRHRMLTKEDLGGFSEELQEHLLDFVEDR